MQVLGFAKVQRPFVPNAGIPGGSKKGKPQAKIPELLIVVADAIFVRAAGSIEKLVDDRAWPLTCAQLKEQMDTTLPGWQKYWPSGKRKTALQKLLKNRVYKGYYNGTSSRGVDHDPSTRASISTEHWRTRVGTTHMLREVWSRVRSCQQLVIKNWKEYL